MMKLMERVDSLLNLITTLITKIPQCLALHSQEIKIFIVHHDLDIILISLTKLI